MEKISPWRGRKFSLATQKNTAILEEQAYSNKILQNKQKYTTKQPLAVSHWPLAKQQNINQKLNIKHNAQIKSAQLSNMTYKTRRLTRREAEGE